MASRIHTLIADIGAEFKLGIRHKDFAKVSFDYSLGYSMRFVIMNAIGGVDIFDVTSPDSDLTLSDGAGDTANILISIGVAITKTWTAQNGVYELQIWPTASPDAVNIPIKGKFVIREGLL